MTTSINTHKMPVIKEAPAPLPKKELSGMEFFVATHLYLEEGVREGQSQDFVTSRILKLSQENPQTAKALALPEDFQGIKRGVVAPFYAESKGEQKTELYQFSKTADCLLDETSSILTSSVLCVTSAAGRQLGKAIISCGAAVSQTAACIKEGFEK